MDLHLPTLLTVCIAAVATSAGVMTLLPRDARLVSMGVLLCTMTLAGSFQFT